MKESRISTADIFKPWLLLKQKFNYTPTVQQTSIYEISKIKFQITNCFPICLCLSSSNLRLDKLICILATLLKKNLEKLAFNNLKDMVKDNPKLRYKFYNSSHPHRYCEQNSMIKPGFFVCHISLIET